MNTRMLCSLLLLTGFLQASPIVNVQFLGTGGVTDGSGDEVLPYFLSINGGPAIAADCYDFFDTIPAGGTWLANVDTLAEAVATGRFSSSPGALAGYKLIGVLSTLAAVTPQDEIDLQEDLWNVFDPGAFAVDAGMAADLATASAEMPTFDFTRVEYIEPTSGESAQPFAVVTPEPATILLIGTGLVAIWLRHSKSERRLCDKRTVILSKPARKPSRGEEAR